MTATLSGFRAQFPECTDPPYTDPMVTAWLAVAVQLVDPGRWGDLTDFGVYLITAHYSTMAVERAAAAAAGKPVGKWSGILTSKAIDGVSAGYDASAISTEGGGHWNLTTYGLQYLDLRKMMGAGPVQVSPDACVGQVPWPGVMLPPW